MKVQREILRSILSRFHRSTGLSINIEAEEVMLAPQQRFDALLTVRVGQIEVPLVAEVKQIVEFPETLRKFLASVRRPFLPIVVAKEITTKMKGHLRKRGIAFLSGDGDFFLPIENIQRLEVSKSDKKRRQIPDFHPIHKMGYVKLGLALVRSLEAQTMNFSQLSKALNVSIGTVSSYLNDWKKKGLLLEKEGLRRFKDVEGACRVWARVYAQEIKPHPAIFLGNYESRLENFRFSWKTGLDLRAINCEWGGEPGASLLTDYLEPEVFTVYAGGELSQLIGAMKLAPKEDGNIRVYRSFFAGFKNLLPDVNRLVVDPMVIYSDLAYSSSSRNREISEMILKEFILENK